MRGCGTSLTGADCGDDASGRSGGGVGPDGSPSPISASGCVSAAAPSPVSGVGIAKGSPTWAGALSGLPDMALSIAANGSGGIAVPGDDSGGINHAAHKYLSGVPATDTAPLELNIDAKFGQITVEQR